MLQQNSTEENFSCEISRRKTLIWFGGPVVPALVMTLVCCKVDGGFNLVHVVVFQITYSLALFFGVFLHLILCNRTCRRCCKTEKIWREDHDLTSLRIDTCAANATTAFQNVGEFDENSLPPPVVCIHDTG